MAQSAAKRNESKFIAAYFIIDSHPVRQPANFEGGAALEWFKAYEEDLKWAFEEAARRTAALAPPFDGQAREYLDRFNLFEREVPTNYICFLLPFWIEAAAQQRRETSRTLSLANLFLMMAFMLQDKAMDKPDADLPQTLALSRLLHTEFMMIYARLFPADSLFWTYFRKYEAEWARAVAFEAARDWFHEEPLMLGHKAAPVKLAATAQLLLSPRLGAGERQQLIQEVETAVDHTLVVLQLLDDWEDWDQDLESGSYNSLVSLAREVLQLPQDLPLPAAEMKNALYTHGLLSRYAQWSRHWDEAVTCIREVAPELHAFYQFLTDNLRNGARQIEEERQLLQSGGLHYWLMKSSMKSD
jgi:hypothetical protein